VRRHALAHGAAPVQRRPSKAPLGAYGYFKLTDDVTRFTDLPFYANVGARMRVFVPFVRRAPIFMVPRARAGAPTLRGLASPSQERELWDSPWDHISLMSTAPTMYGSQSARWTNADGDSFWARKHFRIAEPIDRPALTHERTAAQIEARWYRALAHAIDHGKYPCWTVSVQLVRTEFAEHEGWNPFVAELPWPFVDAPLHKLGTLVLRQNSGRLPSGSASRTHATRVHRAVKQAASGAAG
jgi:catalase